MPPTTRPTVLIVEDHPLTARFLADNLAADGYVPLPASTLEHARRLVRGGAPAIAVLDLQLPDGDGLELLAELRGTGEPGSGLDAALPVLVLSGRATEIDRIRGLARGADDYLTKPYGYGELRARLDALLRRCTRRPEVRRLAVATLELDVRGREAWVEGTPVRLSKKEFALTQMLAAAPTRTFTREELLREVWGFRSPGTTRTLDTHAHRLRHKLSTGRVAYVRNVWGVGYRLIEPGPHEHLGVAAPGGEAGR